MARKHSGFTIFFGLFAIITSFPFFLVVIVKNHPLPSDVAAFTSIFGFFFVGWLVARHFAKKKPDPVVATAIAAPPIAPEPPAAVCEQDPSFTISKHHFVILSNFSAWIELYLPPEQTDLNRTLIAKHAETLLHCSLITDYLKSSHATPYKMLVADFNEPIRAELSQFVLRVLNIPRFYFDTAVALNDAVNLGLNKKDLSDPNQQCFLHALPYSARTKHVYVAGKSQHGKSTFLLHSAIVDISHNKGIAVIDPHGDLVESIIKHIAPRRVEEVIYLDAETAIPIDFMSYSNEREKEALVGDIIFLLQRFPGWGPRMDSILRNILYTLLEAGETCFLDIYYFLVDEDRRAQILSRVTDPDLLRVWSKNFPSRDAIEPIITRMTTFVRSPSLKIFMSGGDKQLDIYDVMQTGKILLVNLVKSGKETGDLLGSLIVSKIQQAAMRRYSIPPEERKPFYLYADEFERFQTMSFDIILSEAGKFKLGLVMANQYVDQLDRQILSAVIGNVSTFLLFRMDEKDARHFISNLKRRRHATVDEWASGNYTPGKQGFLDGYVDEALPPDALEQLPPGLALYKAADGSFEFVDFKLVPWPFTNCEEIIKRNTLAEYGMKRTGDNEACNSAQVRHDEGNDEPQPGGAPNIPIHQG
jgi:hypothetical protein